MLKNVYLFVLMHQFPEFQDSSSLFYLVLSITIAVLSKS